MFATEDHTSTETNTAIATGMPGPLRDLLPPDAGFVGEGRRGVGRWHRLRQLVAHRPHDITRQPLELSDRLDTLNGIQCGELTSQSILNLGKQVFIAARHLVDDACLGFGEIMLDADEGRERSRVRAQGAHDERHDDEQHHLVQQGGGDPVEPARLVNGTDRDEERGEGDATDDGCHCEATDGNPWPRSCGVAKQRPSKQDEDRER